MQITNEFDDDHLPCVEFNHNGVEFSLWWTSNKLIGHLQLIADGDLPLESLQKKHKRFYDAITNPKTVVSEDDDTDGEVSIYDEGNLTFKRLK